MEGNRDMREGPWLLPGEVAKRLGMTRSGVLWLADTRRVRAVRTATGVRLISRREVERLRKQREQLFASK